MQNDQGAMRQRERLPERRESTTETVHFYVPMQPGGDDFYEISASFYADGRPAEVFIVSDKGAGSRHAAIAHDTAIIISIALQYGAPLEVMRAAVAREHDGVWPSSPIGMALDTVAKMRVGD